MKRMISALKLSVMAVTSALLLPAGTQAQTVPSTYTLEDRVWEMIVVPGIRGNRTTVEQYFGSSLAPADLGTKWVLYEFEPFEGRYVELESSSLLKPGVGYWITQITGADVLITPPNDAIIAGLPYDGCNDGIPDGAGDPKDLCNFTYVTGDKGPSSVGTGSPWRMAGNPGSEDINFTDIVNGTVASSSGGDFTSAGFIVATQFQVYRWDNGTYTTGDISALTTTIPPGTGFWYNGTGLSPTTTYALLLPTKESKTALASQCPAVCLEPTVSTPPPPPIMLPASTVEVGTTDVSNDLQVLTHASVSQQKFFTFTAGAGTTPPKCEINAMSFVSDNNGDYSPVKGDLEDEKTDLTDLEFVACIQGQIGSDQSLQLNVPLPSEQLLN